MDLSRMLTSIEPDPALLVQSPNRTQKQIVDQNTHAAPLATLGALQVRLARTRAEVRAAQTLRYAVFVGTRGHAMSAAHPAGIDHDAYDSACDHLVVLERGTGADSIVATCRLLPAARAGILGCYSDQEFDLKQFLVHHHAPDWLEVGRSCVATSHRHRRTIELLWRGLWAYAQQRRIGLMFGCASLPAGNDAQIAQALNYLQQYAAAPESWGVRALPGRRRSALPVDAPLQPPRQVFASLPPLLKGYLRLGARVCLEAVDDEAFGTTDVFVALQVADIARRYTEHYRA